MDKEKATERIGIRITSSLKEELEKRANEEGRSMSNLIIKIVEEYINKINEAKRILK